MLPNNALQEDLVSLYQKQNSAWNFSALKAEQKNALLHKINRNVLEKYHQWILAFQPELLTDDIIEKINMLSSHIEPFTKITPLQDKKFFAWLFTLQASWLTDEIITKINASIQYIKITNLVIYSYENLHMLISLWQAFANLEKSAEFDRQKANALKIITEESSIELEPFLELVLDDSDAPHPALSLEVLQHIRLVHPYPGILNNQTLDHVYLYKELVSKDENKPGLVEEDPCNRRRLTVEDIRKVTEKDIDLEFANKLIEIKRLLMSQKQFDQYCYTHFIEPAILKLLQINAKQKDLLKQKLQALLTDKINILTRFKTALAEYEKKRLYLDKNGELKPRFLTNPDRLIAYQALKAQIEKSNSMALLYKVMDEQALNIDLDGPEHIRIGLQQYCLDFIDFHKRFKEEIKLITVNLGNDIRAKKKTNFYFLISPDIFNEIPEGSQTALVNKCPQLIKQILNIHKQLGSSKLCLDFNEKALIQLHQHPKNYGEFVLDVDLLTHMLEEANHHAEEDVRRKTNHLLCNLIFDISANNDALNKFVNNLACIPNASIKYLSFYWQVHPQNCVGKMNLATFIEGAKKFHEQKTKLNKGDEIDDPQHQLTDMDLMVGLEWIETEVSSYNESINNLVAVTPFIEIFISVQKIDQDRQDYNLTTLANKIKNDQRKPCCYLGIYSIDDNHYVPYCIFKNNAGEINVITVDPAYASISKFKSKLTTELLFKNLFPDCSFEDPFVTQQFNGYDCGINSLQTIYEISLCFVNPSPSSVVSIDSNNHLQFHPEHLSINSNTKEFIVARDKFKIKCVENRVTWENRLTKIEKLKKLDCPYSFHGSRLEQTRHDQKELYQNRVIGEFLNHSLFTTCLEQWMVNHSLNLVQAEPYLNSFLNANEYVRLYRECNFNEIELKNKLLWIINHSLPEDYAKFCKDNTKLLETMRKTGVISVELINKINTTYAHHLIVKAFIEKQLKTEISLRESLKSKMTLPSSAPLPQPSIPAISDDPPKPAKPIMVPTIPQETNLPVPPTNIFSDEPQKEFVKNTWWQIMISSGTIGASIGGSLGSLGVPLTAGLSWPICAGVGFIAGAITGLLGLAFGMLLESMHKSIRKTDNVDPQVPQFSPAEPGATLKGPISPTVISFPRPFLTKKNLSCPNLFSQTPARVLVKASEIKGTFYRSIADLRPLTKIAEDESPTATFTFRKKT